MEIRTQELVIGCGEWSACVFDSFGQPIISVKSIKSEQDAKNILENLFIECVKSHSPLHTWAKRIH